MLRVHDVRATRQALDLDRTLAGGARTVRDAASVAQLGGVS
jgi:dihydropteroate synthase